MQAGADPIIFLRGSGVIKIYPMPNFVLFDKAVPTNIFYNQLGIIISNNSH